MTLAPPSESSETREGHHLPLHPGWRGQLAICRRLRETRAARARHPRATSAERGVPGAVQLQTGHPFLSGTQRGVWRAGPPSSPQQGFRLLFKGQGYGKGGSEPVGPAPA